MIVRPIPGTMFGVLVSQKCPLFQTCYLFLFLGLDISSELRARLCSGNKIIIPGKEYKRPGGIGGLTRTWGVAALMIGVTSRTCINLYLSVYLTTEPCRRKRNRTNSILL